MSLFSRKKPMGRGPIVPREQLERLPAIGRATYLEGQITDVTDVYISGYIAAGSPLPGAPEFAAFIDGFLGELFDAAACNADEWAFAGALRAAADFIGPDGIAEPLFVAIVD